MFSVKSPFRWLFLCLQGGQNQPSKPKGRAKLMDIKELLESDEGKALIASAVEEATKPLVAKRDELLGKLKEKNDKLTEAEQIAKDAAEAKAKAEEEAILKSGDVEKIKKQLEDKYTKEIETRDASIKDKDSKLHGLLVDSGLTDALSKAGVAPQFQEDLRLAMKAKYNPQIADVDGKPTAQIDGKSLTDFVSEWSQGDQGKPYIAAPNNGGGGANGANGGGKANTAKGDLSGDKKSRTEAFRNQYPELS